MVLSYPQKRTILSDFVTQILFSYLQTNVLKLTKTEKIEQERRFFHTSTKKVEDTQILINKKIYHLKYF